MKDEGEREPGATGGTFHVGVIQHLISASICSVLFQSISSAYFPVSPDIKLK